MPKMEPGADIVLFKNARLVCPLTGRDGVGSLLVERGIIAAIDPKPDPSSMAGVIVTDCGGHMLCPGLIDMQVFTGEPGDEHKETLATASRAAAAGGVTTMLCMPNTDPVIDDVALVFYMKEAANDKAIVHVHPVAALTRNLEGQEITEIGLLKEAGAAAFTNGKRSVSNTQVMRLALAYAKDFEALILHFTEDRHLAEGGMMHEGEVSSRLGLQGIPSAAEIILLERDLRLVALTGGRYHAATLSCAGSLAPLRAAKTQGLNVTCGVSINNLTLNEHDVGAYRTFFKLKPPLRGEDDRKALVAGLKDGIIDVIVSNHDPQDDDTKRRPFDEAYDGAVGLETMLTAALQLVHRGEIELLPLLAAMTANPARILNLQSGCLRKGAPADLALVHLDLPWRVDAAKLRSKSKNTPFENKPMLGKVLQTFVLGRRVFHHSEM
jgi:dihydroorotase